MDTAWARLHDLVSAAERNPSDGAFNAIEAQVRRLRNSRRIGAVNNGVCIIPGMSPGMDDEISRLLQNLGIAITDDKNVPTGIIIAQGNTRSEVSISSLDINAIKKKYTNIIILRYHLNTEMDNLGRYKDFKQVVNLWIEPFYGQHKINHAAELRKAPSFAPHNAENIALLKSYISGEPIRSCIECNGVAEYAELKYFCSTGCQVNYHDKGKSE